ncbi:MAG: BamA/TamA family outer membrane protein [Ignavibacteria bacterium]
MNLKHLFLLTLLLSVYQIANSNIRDSVITISSDSVIVNSIVFVGLKHTEEEVVRRELETKEGQKLDLEILQEDVKKLYNLGLFNKVEVVPVPFDNNSFKLIFVFEETFYILPLPIGGFENGDFKKFWGGLNLTLRNFRGWNQTLNFSFALGYQPFVGLSFFDPWIGRKSRFYAGVNIRYNKFVNRVTSTDTAKVFEINSLDDYHLHNFTTDLRIGKFLNKYLNLWVLMGINLLQVSDYLPGRTVSPDGKDFYFLISSGVNYDSRDNIFFTLKGFYLDFSYTKYGLPSSLINFHKTKLDVRGFIPIRLGNGYSVSIASRLLTNLSFGGGVPVYLNEVYGFGEMIRGWKYYVLTGENLFGSFTEIRIPLIQPFFINGKEHFIINRLPILKEFSYRYGLYLTTFFDIGTVWDKKETLTNAKFHNGFGLGLNFLLPFNIITRIDYGMRINNSTLTKQFIIGLSSSF